MELAIAIEKIHFEAQYFGATDENTKEQFDALTWLDEREKPTWAEIQAAWTAYEKDLEIADELKATTKAELLARLGITEDEAKLLLA
jgi:hypothetical protein